MRRGDYCFLHTGTLLAMLLLTACRPTYEVTGVEGGRIAVDSVWDAAIDAQAASLVAPYKAQVDSLHLMVIGTAAMTLERGYPENPLSNLITDVLRDAGSAYTGKPVDMGLVNFGGIRTSLAGGTITLGDIYEILPFENALCILTMNGETLLRLFAQMAARGGEGISGAKLTISKEGKLLQAKVGGKSVETDRRYTIATIDFVAEGNDGMTACAEAEARECPQGSGYTLREIVIDYIKAQTAAGKPVSSRLDGRISVQESTNQPQ
ncbi:MAG: 5'-nucleotidase C-terminal domain-containing protein [Prevotellaceae bacterium]|nr:5'-nucleotidase C-terminal domain-containing protein [Prevotellaceae bacterium]